MLKLHDISILQFAYFLTLLSVEFCHARPFGNRHSVRASNGTIVGHQGRLANRFTIPFAQAPVGVLRFSDPVEQTFPVGPYDASSLPPACPQSGSLSISEDCLYMSVYVPKSATSNSRLPVMFWVHGGTFSAGSESMYDLDGSQLAADQNMIVVVTQYRLGLLGWMSQRSIGIEGNYGLKDVILALQSVQKNIAFFGGDASRVTLAGESTGAEIVKSLLVTPSASSLFTRAILHSAPLAVSDWSPELADSVGATSLSTLKCTTLDCARALSIPDLLNAQTTLIDLGQQGELEGVRVIEPVFRPTVDGSLVQNDFGDVVASDRSAIRKLISKKTVLLTTMQNEGALTAVKTMPSPANKTIFPYLVGRVVPEYASVILKSGLYDPSLLPNDADVIRDQFARAGTDFVFSCANQQTGLNLTSAGFRVYLGQFNLGVSFYNDTIPYLVGKASHQDDIALLFRPTYVNLTRGQRALTSEVQARWGAFVTGGSPNAGTYTKWSPIASGSNLNLLVLGADTKRGESRVTDSQNPTVCAMNGGLWTRV